MRRGLLLLVALGLAIVAAAVLASGRRAPVIAFGTLLAGAVVAFVGSTLLVDCASCRTDALIVGALPPHRSSRRPDRLRGHAAGGRSGPARRGHAGAAVPGRLERAGDL
jgi:hypothetical protein